MRASVKMALAAFAVIIIAMGQWGIEMIWGNGPVDVQEAVSDVLDAEVGENKDKQESGSESPENGSDDEKSEGEEVQEPAPAEPVKPETPKVETPAPVVSVPAVPARGDVAGKKLVALTFDDGPSRATTVRLLDILKAKNVKATFFVVGNMVRNAPEVVQREVAEGHEVGSHTVSHAYLTKLGAAGVQNDTATMRGLLSSAGVTMRIMRPPYGAFDATVKANVGVPMIYWSVDTLDWKTRNAAAVRSAVASAVFDGAVILMHDIHATTVDAVSGVIDDLRAAGYEFLTVSEMAATRGVTMAAGGVYGSFKP